MSFVILFSNKQERQYNCCVECIITTVDNLKALCSQMHTHTRVREAYLSCMMVCVQCIFRCDRRICPKAYACTMGR